MLKGKKPAIASLALLILLGPILSGLSFVSALSPNMHTLLWEQYYDEGYSIDVVERLIQTSDGGYAFAATRHYYPQLSIPPSILLFKTDNLGVVEWQKQFNGSATVAGLVQTSDSGYIFACDIANAFSRTSTELIKIDSTGNLQWNRTYTYAGPISSMIQTSDGGFALAGTENSPDTLSSLWLIKTNSEGELEWKTTFEQKLGDHVSQLIQTADSNYAIVGYTYSGNATRIGTVSADLVLLKISGSGSLLWKKTYDLGISNRGLKSIVQTSDGGYVLTDNTGSFGMATAIKTDEKGEVQWTQNYTVYPPNVYNYTGQISSVILTSDGGLAFVGDTPSGNVSIIKTDAMGNIQWNQTYGERDQYGYKAGCLIESSDGNLLVGGSWQHRSKNVQYYVAKIQADLPLPTPSPSPLNPSPTSSGSTPLQTNFILLAALAIILTAAIVGLLVFFRRNR